MDLVTAVFNVGVGIGVLLVGGALVYLAVQTAPLLHESRALAADARRLTRLAEEEARPILAHSRELAANAEVLSEDVAVKLDRLNDLMNALQHTLETVTVTAAPGRVAIGSVESVHPREDDYTP